MRKNSKGFTLIELIVTIILLGIVATVIIFNVSQISKNSLEKEYEAFRQAVVTAAETYSIEEKEVFEDLFINRAYLYITTGDLISGGYLREDLVNPKTKQRIGKDEKIKALLDTTTGAITFEYPAESTESEQYLMSLMDYVANGEPYDCMQGIGTYRLSLADEDGLLITDANTLINDYKLTCSYDSRMSTWTDTSIFTDDMTIYGDSDHNIKYSNEPNDYDITYTWITKSGTRKSATRKLRVLETFVPSVEIRVVTTDYPGDGSHTVSIEDFENGTPYDDLESGESNDKVFKLFTPSYSNGKWTYLAYRPTLIGADTRNTSITIKKKISNDSTHYTGIVNHSTKTVYEGTSFDVAYPADDGEIQYTISMSTGGHYFSNFKLNNASNITIKQDLVLPISYISGGTTSYNTKKTFNITDPYSRVGISKYEYAIGTKPQEDRDAIPSAVNVFNRTSSSTEFTYNALPELTDGACYFEDNTNQNIYFRAINRDGYYGSWTRADLYTSNNLSRIIDSNRGDDCTSACSQDTDNLSTNSLGSISCYYCDKVKYVSYNNKLFNVLGKKGENVIIADNESYIGEVQGTDITENKEDTYGVQTVDGYFETTYSYTYTVAQKFFDKVKLFETNNMATNYNRVFAQSLFGTGNQGSYVGYSAAPTESDVNLFGNALDGEYWIAESGVSSTFNVTVHDITTEKSNYYWYYRKNDGTIDIYTGGARNLKTMHLINKGYICAGNGTESSPYVISKG